MKIRTVALALALTFGMGAAAEAKTRKAPVHRVKKVKHAKARKAPKRAAPRHN
jgi:hypothetical protein